MKFPFYELVEVELKKENKIGMNVIDTNLVGHTRDSFR